MIKLRSFPVRHEHFKGILRLLLLNVCVFLCFATSALAQFTNSGTDIYNTNSGNVGLGSTSPATKLHIVTGNTAEASVRIENSNASYTSGISFYTSSWAERGFVGWRGDSAGSPFNSVGMFLLNRDNSNLVLGTNNQEQMRIDTNGNVGIGTNYPTSKLDVDGDVTVSGNISARYQDIAEWVPTTQVLSAGTVVALDTESDNGVVPSSVPYDTHVAGVVSDSPGIILGLAGPGKLRIATTGRVKVHVDTSNGPIRRGDLLVTGTKEGMAMRSETVSVGGIEIHRPGTLIGKALEPLESGEGEILVLLSLQ